MVSVYSQNKQVCEHVAAIVRCLKGPCVTSGDWNMEPDVLSRSGFLGMVNGTIIGKRWNLTPFSCNAAAS